MDLKQELRDLAADGSDASVSLMRDLVINNPQHGYMALELWTEIGSDEAEFAIFKLMKEYPGSYGIDGIRALTQIDNLNGLADVYNFISISTADDKTKFTHMMYAMDLLRHHDNPSANTIVKGLLDMHELIPVLRVDVLRERAIGGEDDAVDALGEIAMIYPDIIEDVRDALLDIDSEHAKQVYALVQDNASAPDQEKAPDDGIIFTDMLDLDFLKDMGIDRAPDDEPPQDAPEI